MGRLIVVVDDDRVTRTLLKKTLSEAGYEVQTASDGIQGLNLLQTQSVDLAIIDMLIPKIHGLELCKRIRENELIKHLHIILMSAVYQHPTYRRDVDFSGADYFVDKPLDVPKLNDLIDEILGSKSGGGRLRKLLQNHHKTAPSSIDFIIREKVGG